MKKIKIVPNLNNKEFLILAIFIVLCSIAVAIVFTAILEWEKIDRPLAKILLIAIIIIFSIIVASTIVVVIFKSSSEKLQIQDNLTQNILELAVSARVLKVLIPILTAILIFFGWDSWRNLKNDITKEIDPESKIKKITLLIDSAKSIIDSTKTLQKQMVSYVEKLLPVGTIVTFDGKSKLPLGWAICNGQKVTISKDSTFITPNLVNRFIIGTTDSIINDNLPKRIGEIGGVSNHLHTFQCNKNIVTDSNIPNTGKVKIVESLKTNLEYSVNHSHNVNLEYSGKTEMYNSLPPYCALIFIIKYK
jgi:hypothetical protein